MNIKKFLLIGLRPLFYSIVRFYFIGIPFNFGKIYLFDSLIRRVSWSNKKTFIGKTVLPGLSHTTYDFNFKCNPIEAVDSRIYFFGIWEPNLTHWILNRLNPGDIFIDIGAYIGYYSTIGARLVGTKGKVIAFEANPKTFMRLKETIELNNINNIRLENIAILEEEGTISLYSGQKFNSGSTTLIKNPNQEALATVKAIPLSKSLSDEEILRTRIIKIDVEGAELSVIKSLLPILNKFSKDMEIVVEISPSRLIEQGFSVDSLLSIFDSEGYMPYEIANDYSTESYVSFVANKKFISPKRIRGNITSQTDVLFSKHKYDVNI